MPCPAAVKITLKVGDTEFFGEKGLQRMIF